MSIHRTLWLSVLLSYGGGLANAVPFQLNISGSQRAAYPQELVYLLNMAEQINEPLVSYVFGTTGGTLEAGVRFTAYGNIDYSYDIPYDLSIANLPGRVSAGERLALNPVLSGLPGASLSASQDLKYQTNLFFFLDLPAPVPNIDVNKPLENSSKYGLDFNFNGAVDNFTTQTLPGQIAGDNLVTQTMAVDAWSISADLIELFVNPADLLGFDLDLSIGMDIQRNDELIIGGIGFNTDAWDIVIPDGLLPGDVYEFTIEDTIDIYYAFDSDFYYTGNVELNLDAPWFDEVNLVDASLGDAFYVGNIGIGYVKESFEIAITESILISDGSPRCKITGVIDIFCNRSFMPYDFSPGLVFEPVLPTYIYAKAVNPEIPYELIAASEPSVLAILSGGLVLMLAGNGCKRKRILPAKV